jgi:hypothetical protein
MQKFALAGARLQAQTLKSMMRYQIEMLSFLERRCELDMKLVDDLVDTDQPSDAFNVVNTFMQNAAYEYAIEASKMISIGSKLAAEAGVEVRREAEEAVEDILVAATA